MKKKYIPFYVPHIPKSTLNAIKEAIDSGWITTGPRTVEFEREFGKVIGSKENITVSSCTAALHLSYLAHKLGVGDEVIVPSFTFCSTINTIMQVGATPIFCDIDEKTLCADPKDIERKITKKTKAIVVVHYSGMPVDMDIVNYIAKKNKIIVIEDAAHAFMTKYKGKYIGCGKNTTCFSFYATKNITTAEGGMIATSSKNLAEQLQILRMHGISKNAWKRYSPKGSWYYDVITPGYKYNMTDIEAVLGLEQLKRVKEIVKKRKNLASHYKRLLKDNKNIILPSEVPYKNSQHAWHIFVIRIKNTSKTNRDDLIDKLKDLGIGTSVHFIPNHMQSYYRKHFREIDLPITEKVFKEIISLPFYEDLKKEQIQYICDNINALTG